MATVDDAARDALAAADTDADILKAISWASNRYRELTTRSRFRSLREVGEVVIPATIRVGTVSVTRGSTVVTGDATAQAAWTDDLAGRHFKMRGRHNWHEIGSVVVGATTELRLKTPFAEDTGSSLAYDIVQRNTRLDPRARHLGKFVWMRLGRELSNETLTSLDVLAPDRLTVSAGGPVAVVEKGPADDGTRLVEIYPYSTTSELIHYVFWPHSPKLMPGDNLPEAIDPYVLKEGILVDLYRYEKSRALRNGKVEAAQTFGNWEARQRTAWEQAIRDAGKADKGLQDVTMILRTGSWGNGRERGLINSDAHTEVFIRGNRP